MKKVPPTHTEFETKIPRFQTKSRFLKSYESFHAKLEIKKENSSGVTIYVQSFSKIREPFLVPSTIHHPPSVRHTSWRRTPGTPWREYWRLNTLRLKIFLYTYIIGTYAMGFTRLLYLSVLHHPPSTIHRPSWLGRLEPRGGCLDGFNWKS